MKGGGRVAGRHTRVEPEAIRMAREASERAYAPYSRFHVGAVVEDLDGRLAAGANIECASIGLSLCAERSAVAVAAANGLADLRRIWIYTPTDRPTPPCGACRELLVRLAGEMEVVLLCDRGNPRRFKLSDLLPKSAAGGESG